MAPRETWALREVSFDVAPGSIVGIIGPNGAGKSTLLKILGRVTPPTSGRAVLRGRVVSLLELGAGFQPELSGRENVYLTAALHAIPRGEVNRRLDAIVDFAELGESIDVPVKRYSSGMYLRLAFSVAINMSPDILLADEVLAVGDLRFQERCLQRVEEAGAQGLTVLFVSHDMAAVRRLCNRVIWLNAGQVLADGDPESVVSRYEQTVYTGLTDKKARQGKLSSPFGRIVSTQLLSPEGELVGAIRVSDELCVKITLEIPTAPVSVRCGLDITTRGILAFRAFQPEDLRVEQPGLYSVTARLPAYLLSDTLYVVHARAIARKDGRTKSMIEDNALSFRVFDPELDDADRDGFATGRSGVVAPRLHWDTVREPSEGTTVGTH